MGSCMHCGFFNPLREIDFFSATPNNIVYVRNNKRKRYADRMGLCIECGGFTPLKEIDLLSAFHLNEKSKKSKIVSNKKVRESDSEVSIELCLGYPSRLEVVVDAILLHVYIHDLNEDRVDEDPWKIKKMLTHSDVGDLCRLMLSRDLVERHILPFFGEEDSRAIKSNEGKKVFVYDLESNKQYELVLKFWNSSGCYLLNNGWSNKFVKGMNLKKGDKVGLFWDKQHSRFNFSILKRAL